MTKTVLLIEDEQNIVEAVRFILSRDGWDVRTHANGLDAFDAVRRRNPDVVILDVMLPGRSGFDILQDIREDETVGNVPVLMLSARGRKEDIETAKRSGANLYLTKPFSNEEVLNAVRDLVTE
ncbi:MAG: response regulator [Roseovarius sp.]|nr:response regulator [Roseovarius sp.]MCY4207347.1 response regulator [Roseovarius sp.]MCY4291664.1 response regulator [Roseovarius sp.]MCY4316128.1 response regulator [Roseovarius sp.]